jgi:hypothetical protein
MYVGTIHIYRDVVEHNPENTKWMKTKKCKTIIYLNGLVDGIIHSMV